MARWHWDLWFSLQGGGPRQAAASRRFAAGWRGGLNGPCQERGLPTPPISPPYRFHAVPLVWWPQGLAPRVLFLRVGAQGLSCCG